MWFISVFGKMFKVGCSGLWFLHAQEPEVDVVSVALEARPWAVLALLNMNIFFSKYLGFWMVSHFPNL